MATAQQGFGLPEDVLAVLPADPFEQLDVARKITSIALSNRVSGLEEEMALLRRELEEKDDLLEELQAQVETLDTSLAEISNQLARTEEEKEALRRENASLAATVRKLNRDVSKLEIFKKTLMQSLQEDDENAITGNPKISPTRGSTGSVPKTREINSTSETGSAIADETSAVESDDVPAPYPMKQGALQGLSLGSMNVTPRLTPPDSPTRLSKPGSPRRHSIAFAGPKQAIEERSSGYSSMPSSHHGSMSGSLDSTAPQAAGRARVDGKEFFRQVRSRLSYEQFSSFLANVKELNSHKQSREETLRKAEEIFGAENRDLYAIFEGLITRTTH